MKRSVYLQTKDITTVHEIIQTILTKTNYQQKEIVSVKDSLSRVTYKPVTANVSSPFYNASAMDGYAIKSIDTASADLDNPITIQKGFYQPSNTGDEIPLEYDAVIMIEDIQMNEDDSITIIKSIKSYENIRPIGEDIINGDIIIPRNHLIRPIDISVMLSAGINDITVYKKPSVVIIPTGDEIIRDVTKLKKGKIIDSNSYYLLNELKQDYCNPVLHDIVKDDYDTLNKALVKAAKEYDLVLVGAGSSAGSKDYTKHIIEENGTVFIHGISIKPGKPTIIGEINDTPIIGVPGYPVSTYITYTEIIRRLVLGFVHQQPNEPNYIEARLSMKVYSSLKHLEFVRMKLGFINNEFVATPLSRKAGSTRSIVDADGILEIPKNSEGHDNNRVIKIRLLKDINEIKKALVVIGSHDIILDTIHDLMNNDNYHVSSSHVGSFSGILAIKSKSAHIAPTHILHTDGTYNTFLIDKYLNDEYTIIKGVVRNQGLYVKKGNKKKIKSINDLVRKDVTFVNRQKGSGTRTLLDYLLDKNNLNIKDINGYNFELTTHTLVANSVLDNRFDTGLGIESVAYLNNLDFIQLGTEEYDFIVRREDLELDIVKSFIKTIKSNTFKEIIENIPGYSIQNIGEIV